MRSIYIKNQATKYLRAIFCVDRLIICMLLAIIGFWYVSSISRGAMWGDESQYAVAGLTILAGNPFVNVVHMFAPLGKYIIGSSQLIFGKTSFGARIGIVLSSITTLYILYYIACQLQGSKAGLSSVVALSSIPLFATHATSAMLDIPLVAGVTVICGLTLLETQTSGTYWRDIVVGVSVIIASASKSYGFVYVASPFITYSVIRMNSDNFRKIIIRVGLSMIAAFFILYFPLMLSVPPNYYGEAEVPGSVRFVFDLPIFGGLIYAFSSSFYFNIFAGHEGSTTPSILTAMTWIANGGPFVVFGVAIAMGSYFLPERYRISPWWVPVVLIFPPIFMFTIVLPKGFSRFVLPVFPVAILIASFVSYRILQELSFDRVIEFAIILLIIFVAASPAGLFLFTDQNLSADSKYDEVAQFLSSKEGNISVIVSGRHELMWYLGHRYTKNYHHYLNNSAVRSYGTTDGHVKLSGIRTDIDRHNQIECINVDYIILSEKSEYYSKISSSSKLKLVETFSAYITGEADTHRLSIWKKKSQDRKACTKQVEKVKHRYD